MKIFAKGLLLSLDDFYNTTSKLPQTNYPSLHPWTGIPYILVKSYTTIGTSSKVMKVYEEFLSHTDHGIQKKSEH